MYWWNRRIEMGEIKKGDLILYHNVAKKNLEKSYPSIIIEMIKVSKVLDETFQDKDKNVYQKYRANYIFRKKNKNKIKNDVYDEEKIFKEDLEELINGSKKSNRN
jgi:hypothetical protein